MYRFLKLASIALLVLAFLLCCPPCPAAEYAPPVIDNPTAGYVTTNQCQNCLAACGDCKCPDGCKCGPNCACYMLIDTPLIAATTPPTEDKPQEVYVINGYRYRLEGPAYVGPSPTATTTCQPGFTCTNGVCAPNSTRSYIPNTYPAQYSYSQPYQSQPYYVTNGCASGNCTSSGGYSGEGGCSNGSCGSGGCGGRAGFFGRRR